MVLAHGPVDVAVGVEVADGDEAGAGALSRRQRRRRQRRPVALPRAVAARVERVDDGCRARGELRQPLDVGRIGGHGGDPLDLRVPARPRHDLHRVPGTGELACRALPDRPFSHDAQAAHDVLLQT